MFPQFPQYYRHQSSVEPKDNLRPWQAILIILFLLFMITGLPWILSLIEATKG